MRKMVLARRISQALCLALFVYILWSTTYPLTGPISPELFFKTDPLVMIMTSLSEKVLLPGLGLALGMLAATLLLGRFFCGWICPLGTAIDVAGGLRRRWAVLGDGQNRVLSRIKFGLLTLIAIAAIFGRQIAWLFDPIVLAGRFVSLNLIPAVTSFANLVFMFLIKGLGLGGPLKDFYHSLKPTILGVKVAYFPHAGLILAYFLIVLAGAVVISRLWCRAICPLGAFYALSARFAPLRRTIDECSKCGKCKSACRTGAIKDDLDYVQGECILCMDCVYTCPIHITKFQLKLDYAAEKGSVDEVASPKKGGAISRKDFFVLLFSSIFLLGFRRKGEKAAGGAAVIRPPAALEEDEFVNRCIRCGNCMKVCITNGLQPVSWQAGIEGIWTPQLVPEIGYCEYRCTLCGNTCPTGAIPKISLPQKLKTRLGTARIDRALCIPWARLTQCIVCEEHCPVADKAIKLERDSRTGTLKPIVNEELCVGCGICQYKCPVRPVRAIRVSSCK